jgi:hypothetical protein
MVSALNWMLPSEVNQQQAAAAQSNAAAAIQQANLAAGAPQANADLTRAQVGNVNSEAAGRDMQNQSAAIDLASKKGMMDAQRKTISEMQSQANQSNQVQQQPQPQQSQAPVSENTTAQQSATPVGDNLMQRSGAGAPSQESMIPTQPAPMKVPTVDDVHSHLSTESHLPTGAINPLSEDFMDAATRQMMQNPNVNPQDVAAYRYNTSKNRLELAKTTAEIADKIASGNKTGAEAQGIILDNKNNQAFAIIDEMNRSSAANGGKPTATALANTYQNAAQLLGIDATTPEGAAHLAQMAGASSKGLAIAEQARKNQDTQSEVIRRSIQNTTDQQNANTARINSGVNQGNLSLAQAKEGVTLTEKTATASKQIDRINQTKDDINFLSTVIKNGSLQAGAGGAYYVSAAGMDPGTKQNLAKYLGTDIIDGKLPLSSTLMSRLGSSLTEVEMQDLSSAGVKGSGSSDERMKLAHDAVGGKLSILDNKEQVLNSLTYANEYLNSSLAINQQRLASNNAFLTKIVPGAQPIAPSYKPKTSGEIASDTAVQTPNGGRAAAVIGKLGSSPSANESLGQRGAQPSTPIVKTAQEAALLKPGTQFIDPDGVLRIRH